MMACGCDSSSIHLVCVCMILLLHCSTVCSSGDFQVVGPDQPLPAVSGEDLILPCSVKPSLSVEGMTVEWLRLNQGQASLVHLYKNGKDQNSRQIQSYRDRTTLFKDDLKMGNASLKLSNIQVSDEGDYKCFIQTGSDYNDALIQVIVRVIGQTPQIISEGVRWDGGINLVCRSEGWKPEPVLDWLDSQGKILTTESTEMLLGPNGFRVKRQLVAYRTDADHYVCRLTQKDERTVFERKVEMETIFHISDGTFTRPWKIPFIISVLFFIIISLMVGLIIYYRGRRKRKRQWELVKTKETEGDFHLDNYPEQGLKRMLPEVKDSKRVWLNQCHLSKASCEMIASVLQMSTTLRELDMSDNKLEDEGLLELCVGLRDPTSHLKTLRLSNCGISDEGYVCLALTLMLNPLCVKELDVSNNHPGESAQKLLSATLEDPYRKVEAFQFADYKLTFKSGEFVAAVLQSPNSLLLLDLSDNDLGDSGVQLLSKGLSSPHCILQTLRLTDCLISEKGCDFLASALTSNPSHLKELDLSYNHHGKSGLTLLSAKLEDPDSKLEILKTDHASVSRARPRLLRYACDLTLDPNTAHRRLSLSEGNRKVKHVTDNQPYADHPERFDYWPQALCREGLTGRCYWEAEWSEDGALVAVAYKSTKRKGWYNDRKLGRNAKSWSLLCTPGSYSAWHNNKYTAIPAPSSGSSRVGVYLDWPASTLSFYSVSSDTLTHLHTFHSTFTEPLYPGFGAWDYSYSYNYSSSSYSYQASSVSLSQIT